MLKPAIRPTVTLRVRKFFDENQVQLKPWSALNETYAQLYVLLNEEKGNTAFWPSLSRLMENIVNDAVSGADLPAPQAELLSSWDIDDLVRDLRSALPGGNGPHASTAVKGFMGSLPAQVLGGFLLLGLATSGCEHVDNDRLVVSTDDSDTSSSTDTGKDTGKDTGIDTGVPVDTDTEWDANCDLGASVVLYDTIENAEIDSWSKSELCKCFESLNEDWDAGLTTLFETRPANEVARALENLLDCCRWENGEMEQPYTPEIQQTLIESTLCAAIVLYKGVSFKKR